MAETRDSETWKLAASDRKSLIRLASGLPKGSHERRAILAGLKNASKTKMNPGLASDLIRQVMATASFGHDAPPASAPRISLPFVLVHASSSAPDEGFYTFCFFNQDDGLVYCAHSLGSKPQGGEVSSESFSSAREAKAYAKGMYQNSFRGMGKFMKHTFGVKTSSEGWAPASRFRRMFELTSRSGEFGVTRDRLVPKVEWEKAERDLARKVFDPEDLIDIVDMLETGDDHELKDMGVPPSVMKAVDALY